MFIGIVKKNIFKKSIVFYVLALLGGLGVFALHGGGLGYIFYCLK